MLADVMQFWAGRDPVNYTAPDSYGVLYQYMSGVWAMVGPQGRVRGVWVSGGSGGLGVCWAAAPLAPSTRIPHPPPPPPSIPLHPAQGGT